MIVSDNQGVVRGLNGISLGLVRRIRPGRWNADLWARVLPRIRGRGIEVARWVPSHRGREAVEEGILGARDRAMNSVAGRLAGGGLV